jgi:hypothetical protein
MDATTSSAVNFPIMSASLRLEVVCIGARSIRCTYCRPRTPPRFNFTTNLVFFMNTFSVRALSILCSYQAPRSSSAWVRVPQPSAFCAEAGALIVSFCFWTRTVSFTSSVGARSLQVQAPTKLQAASVFGLRVTYQLEVGSHHALSANLLRFS